MHTIILLKNILEHHPKDYLKYIMKNLIKVDFQPKEKLECQIFDDYLIITSSKKVLYNLNFYPNYYEVTRYFDDYNIVSQYDIKHQNIQNIFNIELSNNDKLSYEEQKRKDFCFRQLSHNKESKGILLNQYESAYLEEKGDIKAFSSKKVWQGNKESTKVVNMPTNFYYDHTSCVTEENDNQLNRTSFEMACSTSTPIPFQNQVFLEQDLLAYVMKFPFPTMSIHAAINKQGNMSEREVELHDITISKIETTLEIIYQYLPSNETVPKKETAYLSSSNYGIITLKDIDILIAFFKENLKLSIRDQIIIELNRFQKYLTLYNQKTLYNLDNINLELALAPSFNEFIYKLYLSLPQYLNAINQELPASYPILKKD